ncbi:hypothetical protein BDR04DRAFT_1103604 [Suillus decipiens]|nr:hypothetical protein BDR04DRAFT_1103604 [Suillus decipiens]
MSLTNNWNPVFNAMTSTSPRNTLSKDYGGMDLYVRQFGLQNHEDFSTNDTILTAFQNYSKQIISRYSNSPAVFSWLANDARRFSSLQRVSHKLSCSDGYIRRPNHMVSSGISGFQ